MENETPRLDPKKIGFHYFPDTRHYSASDLETWLPALQKLGASWLVLDADAARAIPESFITGLVASGIAPVIHLHMDLPDSPSAADLAAILHAYTSWGVSHVILFDRPNSHSQWSNSVWAQANLVESFLDRFIPLANECLSAGIDVIFPPLEPGGNYWDVSFLHNCLLSLQRRNQKALLGRLLLSAYARTYAHPLDWGRGGAEHWPGNKPYATAPDSQDQIGFNNYQWLQETIKAALGRSMPVMLLGVGQKTGDPAVALSESESRAIVSGIEPILADPDVLAANFWLLSADENDPAYASSWVKSDNSFAPYAAPLLTAEPKAAVSETNEKDRGADNDISSALIKHYLLLPSFEWGIADWHLEVIKPFVRKHQPTIGFSLLEAALAETVTVIGGQKEFSEETLTSLRNKGCRVERICGDGTSIASQLAER